MRRIAVALMLALGTAFSQSTNAQAPFQTEVGRLCLESWITVALQQLNSYNGTAAFNAQKPRRVNRFGFVMGTSSRSNYEPDNWVQNGASRDPYMWNFLYTSELQYPIWPDRNFTNARVPGLRYFVRRCIEGAIPPVVSPSGSSTTGSIGGTGTPQPPGVSAPTSIAVAANAICPPTLDPLKAYPGVIVGCACGPAQLTGNVWGSGPYTVDSSLCNAARHAGAIQGSGGTVWATVSVGLGSYNGTTRFGVTSLDFGKYGASTSILNSAPGLVSTPQIDACPINLTGKAETLTCSCAPLRFSAGRVWGTGIYTNDSNLCKAALHAGVVSSSGGIVTVRTIPDVGSYVGSTSNGVTSSDYGAWRGAIEFPR